MVNEYKVKSGQDVFVISNQTLDGLDDIVLGLLSPSGISFISNLTPLQQVYFDDSYITDNTIQIELDIPDPVTNYSILGKVNQSIFDLCIMNYANLDKLMVMIQANTNIVSPNDMDAAFKTVNFDTVNLVDGYVVSTIQNKRYDFATLYKQKPGFLQQENLYYILQENGYKIKIN